MADYQFSTVWRVEASIQEVWDVFSHPDQWPEWWESLERIVEIKKGDISGLDMKNISDTLNIDQKLSDYIGF